MTDVPKNKLLDLVKPKQHYSDLLADLVTGNEIAMTECMLFLHDKGRIDKNELAQRFRATGDRMTPLFAEEGRDPKASTLALYRMAYALEHSAPLDEKGDPA